MCENLHYESVYFKELHNEQEYYWPAIYRAGAAVVVSTITSIRYGRFFEMSSVDAKWPESSFATSKWHILEDGRILWKHLANFLKTNLTKFAVIWVKRRQKAGFVSPRSSKIHTVTKEKERRKGKSEEEERRRREKSNSRCTLGFYNGYFGESFWPKKNTVTLNTKGPAFGSNVFKNPARYICIPILYVANKSNISKKISSFHYLPIWSNKKSFKGRLKAFIGYRAVS